MGVEGTKFNPVLIATQAVEAYNAGKETVVLELPFSTRTIRELRLYGSSGGPLGQVLRVRGEKTEIRFNSKEVFLSLVHRGLVRVRFIPTPPGDSGPDTGKTLVIEDPNEDLRARS